MKRIPVIMIASLFVIGIPAITQSDPVPKKNGNKYVLYEERTDNEANAVLMIDKIKSKQNKAV